MDTKTTSLDQYGPINHPSPVTLSEATIQGLSPYVSPTPGDIPVVALGNAYNNITSISDSVLLWFPQMGINVTAPIVIYPTSEYNGFKNHIKTLLSSTFKYETRLMVRGGSYTSDMTDKEIGTWINNWGTVSTDLSSSGTIGGWMLNQDLSNDKSISTLAELKFGYVGSSYSGVKDIWNRCAYASMTTSKSFSGSTDTSVPFAWFGNYATFIQNVAKTFRPAVWTNRFYAFHDALTDFSIRSGYYQNLEMFRRLAYNTNRPWWGQMAASYISATPHTNKERNEVIQTVSMRYSYELHTMLAFGAQGIVLNKIFATLNETEMTEWAPFNIEGKPDFDINDPLSTLMLNIHTLRYIFVGASVRECRFTKGRSMFNGFTIGFTNPMGNLVSITETGTEKSTIGLLASHILNGGNEYTVIVNVDPQITQEVTISFEKSATSVYPGEVAPKPATAFTRKINPGDWVIFRTQLTEDVILDDSDLEYKKE